MMSIKIILQAFLLISVTIFANDDVSEVTIKQGTLRGKYGKTRQGSTFSSFTAIPYAEPPVGELRFKPPVPAEPWEGVLDATKPHPVCPQIDIFRMATNVTGEEDCLYLNVYTPKLSDFEADLLPVMFYIHGGGWILGSANDFGPGSILDKDVVLVTTNYRLGPLGFFSSGDMNVVGNGGLKDQALAIKWTHDNIARFGGDPKKITVFGQSAGGASAHFHMLSPMSKDLMSGVIAQSGNALSYWAVMPHFLAARRSKILVGNLGCPTYYTDEMMECALKLDAYDIIKETAFFKEWNMYPMIPFKPIIEPNIPDTFLPEDPIDVIKSGKAANVPFMTGITTDEGALGIDNLFGDPDLLREFDEGFETNAPEVLLFREGITDRQRSSIMPEIRKYYFGDKPIDQSAKSQFKDMFSDALMLAGADASVEMHAKFSKKPVYYYLFDYKGSTSFCKLYGCSDCGVCHCDELLYLLNCYSFFPDYEPSDSDDKVTQLMASLWTNFAKYGNPTPETDDTEIPVKWEPAQRGKQNYYYIKSASDVQVEEGLYADRAKFWRDLPMNVRSKRIRDEL